MIDSFGVIAIQRIGQLHAVTSGVAEALICTAAGIFVTVMDAVRKTGVLPPNRMR